MSGRGLARFAADLPEVGELVTLGEGDTPVIGLPVLARRLGLGRLTAKLESLNPTGSYKDRIAAMSLSLARHQGRRGWIASSSGNAGVAMAAYGARAGLPGFLCLVASAPLEKRVPLLPYAAAVVSVDGVGDHATTQRITGLVDQVLAAAKRHDLYLGITAHAFNHDGMRGADTIGYELAEQADTATHVYVSAGGGGLLVAVARGMAHGGMRASVVACQPAGCAPIVDVLQGVRVEPLVTRCETTVSGLQVPNPPDGVAAVGAVTASGGWGTAPADAEILAAQRLLAAAEGVFVEPAAATTLAALIADVEAGRIGSGADVVLVLSGAGWKDLGRFGPGAGTLPVVAVDDIAGRVADWAAGSSGARAEITGRVAS
ncbi:pyridoxal-phosphate dependent enzyme [Jiangella ureilytica]|uniref:Pyridoxal-phosphate dependent enzyme n=1 Tax=Jiangella ureilytica TaxID=2530374 RepID=A0A4R4RV66_9ACTN|nr:pyridoxal-phosphate dependent enzyme [Jiangella ureilytica]TDC53960.1 pyridoxal-phosphate dependent enzyme [Jiangella ureilytica]